MTKYSFSDDYSEGCHPKILDAIVSANTVQQKAYGDDDYCRQARELIREHIGNPRTPVFFVAGGTLANIIVMSSALRSHEAVIAASTGHIVAWEAGAIEATGHKIITVPSSNGKLTSGDVESAVASNTHAPHMAKPRLVYISNATEAGTVYTHAELASLSAVCKSRGLLLFLDGARLGAALTAGSNDLTMKNVAEFVDIFWIGGTKVGALIGEAVVIPNEELADDFSFHIKQRGALLAKGRLLGHQFAELFSGNLFFELAGHANAMAEKLSNGISTSGYSLAAPTESNQIFPILPNTLIEELRKHFEFHVWEATDDPHSVIRLVTSWATPEKQVDAFVNAVS